MPIFKVKKKISHGFHIEGYFLEAKSPCFTEENTIDFIGSFKFVALPLSVKFKYTVFMRWRLVSEQNYHLSSQKSNKV